MTRNTSEGAISRRKFLLTSGAASAVGIAGCTSETNDGGNGSGGSDGGSNGSSDGSSGETTGSGSEKLSGTIEISGSSTVFPLAVAVSELFRQKHPEVKINVRSTGSGGGFKNFFCKGQTAFNNASRPIKESEKKLCGNNNVNPVELKVATDALTVITSPKNDFANCLTVDELSQIFGGNAAQKWSDVRSEWPNKEIERYGAAETSGTFDYLVEVMGEKTGHTDDYQATEDDNTIITGVTGSKYAIGYLGFAYYTSNKGKVKALKIDNGDGCIAPTLQNAKSGKYKPLARPLFTYSAQEALAKEHIAEFAKFFVQKSTDKSLVADKIGYVPNSDAEMKNQMKQLEDAISKAQSN